MEKKDEELIQRLLPQEPELKRFWDEHVQLERALDQLQHKHFLTIEEEVEKKRLQKLKLAGKDQIMAILARHRGH